MPNPNSINFSQTPNQAPTNTEVSRTRTENQSTGQKPNRAVEQEGNRFLHISREELLRVDPANLLPSERQDFIDAHQAWIDKYQKIIDEAKEKETALATEAEAASVAEAETTSTAENENENETVTPAADLSGLDVINADQEPAQKPSAADVDPNAPTEPIPVVPSITPEDIPNSAEAANSVDRITPEALAATKEKAKQKLGLKEVFAKKVLPVVLSAAILISGIVGLNAIGKDSNSQPEGNPSTPPTEQTGGSYGNYDEYAATGEQHEQHGIKDGYGEYGMYDDADKANPLNFANASKVAEVCNNNPTEMAIYTAANEVEALADYYTGVSDQDRPDFLRGANTLDDMENRLQTASADDYDAALQQFSNLLRSKNTTVENFVANGDYHNAYMAKSGDGATTHENVNLVHCITTENGTPCTKFTFHDDNGNETGSIIIKTGVMQTESGWISVDDSGTLCMQKIDQDGNLYVGLTTISANPDNPGVPSVPDTPTPPTPTPPSETIQPKDYENMERIDQNILNDIADDVGTDEVRVTPNPGVSQDSLTERPSANDYEGVGPEIVQNQPSQSAENIQDQISPENNYSQDRGGANANEYAPVQANESAQATADAAEVPVNQAPASGPELDNALNDLGIN